MVGDDRKINPNLAHDPDAKDTVDFLQLLDDAVRCRGIQIQHSIAYSPRLRFIRSEMLMFSFAIAPVNRLRELGMFRCRMVTRPAFVQMPMSQLGKFTELTMLPFSK